MPVLLSDQDRQVSPAWWRKLCGWLWKISGTLVATLALSVFATWLTSSRGMLPSNSPFIQLLIQWPVVLPIGCCLFLVAILARVLSHEPTRLTSPSFTKQNRKQMLQQLQRSYRELSKPTIQGVDWLELSLVETPDEVENITSFVQYQPNQIEQAFPANTSSIVHAYEQAARKLLILGEPGAGKSMLLYQLGSYLVEQAKQDEILPMPVLLPLSSWAVKRPALQDWIYEQLRSPLYNVPRQVCQQWMQDELILPLLDGLDEVEEVARAACIAAINTYNSEHLTPLVVCSRKSEYDIAAEHQRLTLQNAVVVQPLTRAQINTYLIQAGKPLVALRSALRKNPALQELATIPLMLNILMLTYWGTPVRGLSSKASLLYQQIWANYLHRMVDQKKNGQGYPSELIRSWLHWLAQQMRAHNQSIFYLEQLQPDWLPKRQSSFYQWTISLSCGLLGFLAGTLLNLVIGGALNGLIGGLVWASAFLWFFGRKKVVEPVEVVVWSPNGALAGLTFGLATGLIAKLILGFVFRAIDAATFYLMTPAFAIFGVLAMGLSGKQLVARDRLTPNESIRRSVKIGLAKGLSIGLIIGLISGMAIGIINGLALGLFGVLFWGLQSGLFAAMRHFILRFWLWRSGMFPWNAPRFLDDARSRILLRRIGAGYNFTHSLLQDYFVDLDVVTPLAQTPTLVNPISS